MRLRRIGINFYFFAMNVYISTGDNHPFVAIMALPNPPEADPFLMSKNSSKRKIRYRGIRHVLLQKLHWHPASGGIKRVEHDANPGRNKAAAIEASLPAFSNRWNTNGPNIPSFHCSIIPIVSEAN